MRIGVNVTLAVQRQTCMQVACRPLIKFQRLVTLIKYFRCNDIGNKNNLRAHAYDKNKYLISLVLLEMSKG